MQCRQRSCCGTVRLHRVESWVTCPPGVRYQSNVPKGTDLSFAKNHTLKVPLLSWVTGTQGALVRNVKVPKGTALPKGKERGGRVHKR